MPENEYLDATKALRWQAVAQAMRDGCDIDELTDLVRDRFYKTLRNIRKDLPLAEVIEAVDDPVKLDRLFDGIRGANDVRYFFMQAAEEETGRKNVLERFLRDSLENCLYDIPFLASEPGGTANLSSSRLALRRVQDNLSSDLHRIAEKLSSNPKWSPKRPPGSGSHLTSENSTASMLRESLIPGFQK